MHKNIMGTLDMGQKLKHKIKSPIPCTQNLKVFLYNIFNSFEHQIKFPGVGFSTCGAPSVLKSFRVWSISDFGCSVYVI